MLSELFYSNFWLMKEKHFNKISSNFCKKILKTELLKAGFRRPLKKNILTVTRITRDNFMRNQKIQYFLLVDELLNEGLEKIEI